MFLSYATVWFVLMIGVIVATFTVGGLMGMSIPSWGGLLWRSATLAAAAVVFMTLAGYLVGPYRILWVVPTCLVMAPLYGLDFRADFFKMIGFIVVMFIASIIGAVLAAALFVGASAAGGG